MTVVFNGVTTVNIRDTKFAEGPFALQYAGGPIKWRKIQVRPLQAPPGCLWADD